jgi:hypothetical protein
MTGRRVQKGQERRRGQSVQDAVHHEQSEERAMSSMGGNIAKEECAGVVALEVGRLLEKIYIVETRLNEFYETTAINFKQLTDHINNNYHHLTNRQVAAEAALTKEITAISALNGTIMTGITTARDVLNTAIKDVSDQSGAIASNIIAAQSTLSAVNKAVSDSSSPILSGITTTQKNVTQSTATLQGAMTDTGSTVTAAVQKSVGAVGQQVQGVGQQIKDLAQTIQPAHGQKPKRSDFHLRFPQQFPPDADVQVQMLDSSGTRIASFRPASDGTVTVVGTPGETCKFILTVNGMPADEAELTA